MFATPKRHILAQNREFWRILRQNPSRGFCCSELQDHKKTNTFWCAIWRAKSRMRGNETPGRIIIIIIIIIIIVGFSVYLHNSPGDITQFNNKSMQKTEKF